MGYGVGFRGGRWIGYAVPAECDWPDCHEMIHHGMGHQCDKHYTDEDGEEIEDEGCDLYFCGEHLYGLHDDIQQKPDSPRWLWWIVNEDSWAQWRKENPETLKSYQEEIKDFVPDAKLLEELEFERAE